MQQQHSSVMHDHDTGFQYFLTFKQTST